MVALALSPADRVLDAPSRRRGGAGARREGEAMRLDGLPKVPVSSVPWPRVVSHPPAKGIVREIPPVAPPPPRDAPVEAAAETDATLVVAPVAPVTGRSRPRRASLVGLVSALTLHAAIAAGLLALPGSKPEGGGLPEEAAMVAFVELGSDDRVDSEAGAPAVVAPAVVDEAVPTPVDPPTVDPDVVAERPPEPVAAPDPIPLAAEPVLPEPAPVETPPVLATTASAPEAVPPPPAVRSAPPTPKRETTKPREMAPRRDPAASAPRTRPDREARSATAAPGSVERRAGQAAGGAEATNAGVLRSWRAAVLAALARAKRYPEDARALGRGGRAVVTFTIGRDGSVAGVALATSSGVASLDRATLEMPRRASFPPMPAGIGGAQTFTAGVRYDLH